jgi:hypothetical protein
MTDEQKLRRRFFSFRPSTVALTCVGIYVSAEDVKNVHERMKIFLKLLPASDVLTVRKVGSSEKSGPAVRDKHHSLRCLSRCRPALRFLD